jgi:hypothetical protein
VSLKGLRAAMAGRGEPATDCAGLDIQGYGNVVLPPALCAQLQGLLPAPFMKEVLSTFHTPDYKKNMPDLCNDQ